MKTLFTIFNILIFTITSSPPSLAATSMNGIKNDQFGNFSDDWKLVTTRFRKDTEEIRITYANQKAWEALVNHNVNYPDGAVFAKISVITKEDPAFPSSAAPSGARRVQFMVKDKKKYKQTDGWGYALFDAQGNTYPGDEHKNTMACAACHQLVPERGFVFSQPMTGLVPFKSSETMSNIKNKLVYKDISLTELPLNIAKLIPKNFKSVRSLNSSLTKNVFSGTLDEIRPALTNESIISKKPALFLSENKKLFTLVFFNDNTTSKCSASEVFFQSYHTVPNDKNPVLKIEYCSKKNK